MALDINPEHKATGQANFQRVVGKLAAADQQGGTNRRTFVKGMIAAGAAVPVSAAAYFGYQNTSFRDRPIRAAIIGTGDEGGVLVGEQNPAYVQFVAYSDIRPSNQKRIFEDEKYTNANSPRRGFKFHYGNACQRDIKFYADYKELLQRPNSEIEMVVIALPLNLHARVAIEAMRAGKHVLCEKLMAWDIKQCKEMISVAKETDRLLSIGHQRHYSLLYAHALDVVKQEVLGDICHIRALWHRNNAVPVSAADLRANPELPYRDSWRRPIPREDREALEHTDLTRHGFKDLNQLVRWRIYHETGGGLMAELGSHQLDACSIFLGKVKPLAVTAVGGKHFYKDDRECEDHVYCTYEFPGKDYYDEQHQVKDPNSIVVVTYSSISTNDFEPYGECIMGSKGTLIVEQEQAAYLYMKGGRATEVTANTAGARPVLDASSSTAPSEKVAQATGAAAFGAGPPSRGYREEMEHLAYCIRMRDQGMERDRRGESLQPRCPGVAAMADAIVALTANRAMRERRRIVFEREWFDPENRNATPDAAPAPRAKNMEYIVEVAMREGMISERFATYEEARRRIDALPAESIVGIPFIFRELPDGSQRLVREDGKPLQWHRLEEDSNARVEEPLPLSDELPAVAPESGPLIRPIEPRKDAWEDEDSAAP